MSKLDQEVIDKHNSSNNANGNSFLWQVEEEQHKEAIATCYLMEGSIWLFALIRQKTSEKYFPMPFSGTTEKGRRVDDDQAASENWEGEDHFCWKLKSCHFIQLHNDMINKNH